MPDPLTKQADTLVSAAHIQAVGSYTPLVDRFRVLRTANIDSWDFIITIACIFVASKRLADLQLGAKRTDELMAIVAKHLTRWAPDGVVALEDCKRLFNAEYDRLSLMGHDAQYVASDAIGMWAVWNVFGHQPATDEEAALTRAVGLSVTQAFFGWWRE
jgi:hypothetical protein